MRNNVILSEAKNLLNVMGRFFGLRPQNDKEHSE